MESDVSAMLSMRGKSSTTLFKNLVAILHLDLVYVIVKGTLDLEVLAMMDLVEWPGRTCLQWTRRSGL